MGQSGPTGVGSTGMPSGYDPSWSPQQAYSAFQGLDPTQQQGYITQYQGLSGNEQQGWLDATGQQDPTGGVNNPNYELQPARLDPLEIQAPPKSQYPGTRVDTNTWTPDPVNPPGTPATPPATGTEGGNPWDDLTSPRFQAWFTQQLNAGQSPGLSFTGTDPNSAYGTYNTRDEQAALMAQYNALPPEVRAAYVKRYMELTPQEQQAWRNAFGTDNPPDIGNGPATYTGPQSLSNAGRPVDATSNMWYPDPEISKYGMPMPGQNFNAARDLSPAWVRAYGPDGQGGEIGGFGPDGQEWRWAGGKRPQAIPAPPAPLTPAQRQALL